MQVVAFAELDVGDEAVGRGVDLGPLEVELGNFELRLDLGDDRMLVADHRGQRLLDLLRAGDALCRRAACAALCDCVRLLVFAIGGGFLLEDHLFLVGDDLGVRLFGFETVDVGLGRGELRFELGDLLHRVDALRFEQGHPILERPRVDLEQQFALLDGLVLLDVDANHLAFDPRGDLDDVGLHVSVGRKGSVESGEDVIRSDQHDHQQAPAAPTPARSR